MSRNVHYLHGKPSLVGTFFRVGSSSYRRLEDLIASGKHDVQHVVLEAANVEKQGDLLGALRSKGAEIVLDTNSSELASVGKFDGSAKQLAWAHPDARPWFATDFTESKIQDYVKQIAEFAVRNNISVVLSPSHLVDSANDAWIGIDRKLCDALRRELDNSGGKAVYLDRQITVSYRCLRDPAERKAILMSLSDEPIGNLWIRVSDFGYDATAAGLSNYIATARDLHSLGKPLVADYVGGLIGLALVATGAVGGIAHGVGNKEKLDTRSWTVRKKPNGGAAHRRVYLSTVDAYVKETDFHELMNVRHAKSLLGCRDTSCCSGIEDMLKNRESHFLTQKLRQLDDLSKVPNLRKLDHFIDKYMVPSERMARQTSRLHLAAHLQRKFVENSLRLERLSAQVQALKATAADFTRSASPMGRTSMRQNTVMDQKK